MNFIKSLFDSNTKIITTYKKTVEKINAFEDSVRTIKDLKLESEKLKSSLANGEKTLEEIKPFGFALVREAARRVLNMRHYDVQLLAGLALSKGAIAEQKTGEGKTLTATTALYIHALTGKGAHLVTVNDYLVRRDAGWMGYIFHELGLTTGAIIHDENFLFDPTYIAVEHGDFRLRHLRPVSRKEAYAADITYGINSEFGFDYLRDNMAQNLENMVQRGFNFAIVDEADSVLIDEARTPHIISAPVDDDPRKFYTFAKLVKQLISEDFAIDEKMRTASLTDTGIHHIEKLLGVSNIYEQDYDSLFYIEAALKANTLFKLDKDYIVRNNEVILVDEFTGRLLPGRRYSEGLHQAIEAKENVPIQKESRTLATISLQNYFRQYDILSGMTGTASTEAEEFHKIYHIDTIQIPTHLPNVRQDLSDEIYKTVEGKFNAVAKEVLEHNKIGRPVLVGTTSIDNNERLSAYLTKFGVKHVLLNAKNHESEAEIIANAGKKGSVVVATNMAGRGVDIILGGNLPDKPNDDVQEKVKSEYNKQLIEWQNAHDEVKKLGGLVVIGTERHESRRIDNQLRGRAGRQGDPGMTKFFVSLEDDLMRIFGGDQIAKMMTMLKFPEDQPLSHPMVSKAIEQSQVKVEGHNFDTRKHLVEYDDVLNKQRTIVYDERRRVLSLVSSNDKVKQDKLEIVKNVLVGLLSNIYAEKNATEEQKNVLVQMIHTILPNSSLQKLTELIDNEDQVSVEDYLVDEISRHYENKDKEFDGNFGNIVTSMHLYTIDDLWSKHLTSIDHIREGVRLRGWAQMDPLIEYKKETYTLFENLMRTIDEDVSRRIFYIQLAPQQVQSIIQNNLDTQGKYAHLDEESQKKLLKKHAKHKTKKNK